MNLRLRSFLLLACFWLAGCPSYSVNPLYTDQDAVEEPALEGTWMGTDPGDTVEITFRKSGNHAYTFSAYVASIKIRQNYNVNLVRLEEKLFMDIEYDEETVDGVKVDEPIGMLPMHAIMKVKISGDDLAFASLDDEAIKEPVVGRPQLKHQLYGGSVLVTAETEDLRRYISVHADDGFSDFGHLKRVGKAPHP
jgi:hypothetical protein